MPVEVFQRYLDQRARLVSEKAMALAPPGDAESGTSHFSIVDARGDIVSMTTTIEAAFGSRIMVRGFLLNNQLTDFDFLPGGANAVAPQAPRSSMAPTIVFKGDEPQLAVGSPGGSMIINYVAKALVGTLDWGLGVQAAITCPTSARATARRLSNSAAATRASPARSPSAATRWIESC